MNYAESDSTQYLETWSLTKNNIVNTRNLTIFFKNSLAEEEEEKEKELITERILNFPTLSHRYSESEHIVNQLSGFCTRCMFTKARHMPFHQLRPSDYFWNSVYHRLIIYLDRKKEGGGGGNASSVKVEPTLQRGKVSMNIYIRKC